jgi:hypothetical protein
MSSLYERCRMGLRKRRFCIFLSALLACQGILLSQQPTANAPSGEHLPAGVWESDQPDGSLVGIDLSVVVPADVPGANYVYPEGAPKPQGSHLQIGVFQRKHRRIVCGDENFFATGWTGPGSEDVMTVYANRKLEIHYHDRRNDSEILRSGSEIDIELVLDPAKDEWTGRFHRNGFDRQVTLHRHSDQPDSIAPTLLLTYTGTPALFRVEMRNPSTEDLVLRLGTMLGRAQYVNAVEFTLTAPDGRVLHLSPPGPCMFAGRVDPLIVPLPAGATFSFLVDLEEYSAPNEIERLHLVPGSYTLQANYTGSGVTPGNVDCRGIVVMPYWIGTVTATPVVFTVPPDGERTPGR